MPLLRRPHTASVLDAENLVHGAGAVVGATRTAAQTVRGQLTPISASTAFEQWGIELQRPHLWLCNESDDGKFKEGDYLEINARRYTVRGIKRWTALNPLNCLECLLEEHSGA